MQKDLLLDIVEEWRELKATNCQPEPYPQLQRGGLLRALIAEASVKMF